MTIAMGKPAHRHAPRPRRAGGAYAVVFAPLLIVMIAFCGLALDLGQLYNRKVDLDGLAKAAALAAARELNGTDAGIAAARARAKSIAEGFKYMHFSGGHAIAWNDAALTFSATAARSGNWVAAGSGGAPAATLYYARVDTAQLDAAAGVVPTFFIGVFGAAWRSVALSDSAVAGRIAVPVTPLAICAMSPDKAAARVAVSSGNVVLTELVQHGFRRGVSYDLMQLNPGGTTPLRYLVNPVIAPGMASNDFNTGIIAPFLCAGTMWVPRLTGGAVRVTRLPSAAPLTNLAIPLNSRFDQFAGSPCSAYGAPPDYNIRSYAYDVASGAKWMTAPATGSPAAASRATTSGGGRLETAADLAAPPTAPGDYGPLWAFARAVKAPSPLDAEEPAGGFPTFAPGDWATLYPAGPSASSSYPASPPTPYLSTSSATGYYQAPSAANLEISTKQRRVLNLPLLSCSPSAPTGPNGSATVLAIARFFMTVPATPDTLIAEFGGLLPESGITGQVDLFP